VEIIPIVDPGLGNSSYVVDLGDGSALVVDPERDPRPYLWEMERRGLTPRFAAETHLHADFVSGSRELAAAGATLLAPVGSDLSFEHRPVEDGDDVDLGGLTLRAIATPGHTPEHLGYVLEDGDEPLALFSGGTLMAGGVARTDLLSPELTEPLARSAYRSIRERLLVLPDHLPVYPTHGSGSFCSAGPGVQRITTIGRERRTNPLLQVETEDEFVAMLLGGLGSYPAYFLRMRELNRSGPAVYGVEPPLPDRLSPHDVASLRDRGALVVDARPIDRFAAGHIPGSLSIELRDQFGTWLGWLADPGRSVVVVVDPGQDLIGLVWQMLNVGFEPPRGVLVGGIEAWRAAGFHTSEIPLVSAREITRDLPLIDVRQASEFAVDHVPGAINVELGELVAGAPDLPRGAQVHCGHGQRAMTAASLLLRHGISGVTVTTGGPAEIGAALAGVRR